MSKLMIIQPGAPITVALICVAGSSLLPIASADPMPNGYDVSCKQVNPTQVTCSISGCPRVKEDEAGDVVHTRVNALPQNEIGKACNSTATETVNTSSGFSYAVQGCRKHSLSSDDCGAWSNYTYTPPAAAAPAPVPNSDKPVRCTAGGYTLPPGSDCSKTPNPNRPAPPPGPNVVVAPDQENNAMNFVVTNKSPAGVDVQCKYQATKVKGPFNWPGGITKSFSLKSGDTQKLPFPGLPLNTTYHVAIDCRSDNGGSVFTQDFTG
ncbi:hypothetical protein [Mycobacterium conspicuum]|uniref:Uncharacterized protein n=1 Tax=Mycobacterium conspicuum TaxID=44010 RepID=A0A1X1T6N3_9MYCO|nr:hypothetical protein [Mycobacterium conspicuum]ORV40187.1 hypothetical protein AWC00_16075 [Mycobacterium conspicuum]BBZ37062.1 hypothetical protein MCNS_01250 [Mycobacterium conspicuum]